MTASTTNISNWSRHKWTIQIDHKNEKAYPIYGIALNELDTLTRDMISSINNGTYEEEMYDAGLEPADSEWFTIEEYLIWMEWEKVES